jgi:peptidoglycan hydrolase-like protein with peptidoglycan-binding domain
MTKKFILSLFVTFLIPVAFASTPTFTASGNGDNNNVTVNVSSADANTGVYLYFKGVADNTIHSQQIGTTNTSGTFTGTVSTNGLGILMNTPVYTITNGYQSNSLSWPYNATGVFSQLNFSQNNITLNIGQNSTFTITGGNGSYYLSSNSNSGILNASISGSTATISAVGNGSTVLTICSANENTCGTVNISINNTVNNGFLLTPSMLNLNIGQQGTVQLSGGTAPYTISTITGNGVAYSFVGNTLTVSATDNGTRTQRVCSANNICSTLTIHVSNTPNNALILNPSSLNLAIGQSGIIQLSGGATPYSVYTVQGNSVSSSVSGNSVTLTGASSGSTSFNVCSSNGTCTPLSVTVGNTPQTNSIGFTLPLAINQVERIVLTGGGSSSYYLQSAISSPVSANITGNMLTVTGITYGTAPVTICQNSSACLSLVFNVNQAAPVYTGTGGPHIFNTDLWFEMTSNEVKELQDYLIGEKYLESSATSYFGPLTLNAVKKFQIANNIPSTGYVGILTRAALNQ